MTSGGRFGETYGGGEVRGDFDEGGPFGLTLQRHDKVGPLCWRP